MEIRFQIRFCIDNAHLSGQKLLAILVEVRNKANCFCSDLKCLYALIQKLLLVLFLLQIIRNIQKIVALLNKKGEFLTSPFSNFMVFS